MKLESRELPNGVRHIQLEGNLDLAGVAEVETQFYAECSGNPPRVLVNLSATRFVASLGIRMLLRAIKTVSARGGRLLLLNPMPVVASALEISGLSQIIVRGSEVEVANTLLQSGK